MNGFLHRRRQLLYRIGCWLAFSGYIAFISPTALAAFTGFYVLLFTAVFSSLLSRLSPERAGLWAGALCVYLALRQFRLDTLLTTVLFISALVSLDILLRPFRRRRFGK